MEPAGGYSHVAPEARLLEESHKEASNDKSR